MEGEYEWPRDIIFPHCDARVLHKPEECMFCAKSKELQAERERLEVSNTGHANRKWPCPADRARSSESLNSWSGNRATTQEDLDRRDKEWKEFWKDYNAGMAESVDASDSKPDE